MGAETSTMGAYERFVCGCSIYSSKAVSFGRRSEGAIPYGGKIDHANTNAPDRQSVDDDPNFDLPTCTPHCATPASVRTPRPFGRGSRGMNHCGIRPYRTHAVPIPSTGTVNRKGVIAIPCV